MKKLFLALATLVLAAGCNDTEQPLSIESEQPVTLPAEGGSAMLAFTAPYAWSASLLPNASGDPTDWLTIEPTSGAAGQHTITLTAQANKDEGSRSLSISLSSGQQTTPVLVTQLGTADADSTNTPVFVPETAIRQAPSSTPTMAPSPTLPLNTTSKAAWCGCRAATTTMARPCTSTLPPTRATP